MPPEPGSYLLELTSRRSGRIRIGRHGILLLQPGCYYYAGSAFGPGGLAARVGRHRRAGKAKRWHLDYLRPFCRVTGAWFSTAPVNLEHRWSALLASLPEAGIPLAGFGASDCRCPAHLYYCPVPLGRDLLARVLGDCTPKGSAVFPARPAHRL